ncbi:PepSY-associated TM helix domain-containing protein [Arundinibacter roseus]|uniref:PepSY domain-containing protein n=1 Tax=Arundinibacter roseus TaxID=2070510 RepID=A0A4R4KAR7_9BACT|nr:PepSY-associated TM helix domain-containing protein [Arundinibacter roseus]TDB63716.1 PepSY domain-containing protein [Arundinibacter roseus]
MSKSSVPQKIAQTTRLYRKLHTWAAVPLFVCMFLIGTTGLLLGWKKQAGILPKTAQGTELKSQQWISLDSIQKIAKVYVVEELNLPDRIDRIDVRPQKGIAKIVFVEHFTELQIDCSTGKILSVNTRTSDIIEKIHDGSLLDFWMESDGEAAKLTYTSIVSLGLILLSFSGFWLWYNPIRIRRMKRSDSR